MTKSSSTIPGGHPEYPMSKTRDFGLSCHSVCACLKPLTPHYRGKVQKHYKAMGGKYGRFNNEVRAMLSEAIFKVEDEIDYSTVKNSQSYILAFIRNSLYDVLGWNENRNRSCL